jgi:hypothetical protein
MLEERRFEVHKANKVSDKLIQAAKLKKFNEIFLALDSDGDGVISGNFVNLNIESELLAAIFPIISDIDRGLNLKTFLKKCYALYPQLSQHQKNLILKFKIKEKKPTPQYTFSPRLN